MKKILTVVAMIALCANISYGATVGLTAKEQFKANVNKTKADLKSAVKSDVENAKKQNDSQALAKKQEKIKQIDLKLNDLKKQEQAIKQNKSITETQRTLELAKVQHQINYYTKQKEALK